MLNKIRAALGRLLRPRRRRTGEHGSFDQRAARSYRDQQDVDSAKGGSYGWPPGGK
jgi:hypothetical protein